MADDQDAAAGLLVHLFKHADEVLEAPQVDACLRLIEDGQLGAAGQHHGDLDALQLAAGQAVV